MPAPSASDTIIVITGGDPVDPSHLEGMPSGVTVIAADSGIDHALALGLHIDVAVGDFDSVSPRGLQAAADGGAAIEQHPEAKDETDLELALDAALARGARRVRVLGGHGGRLDHFLANALLLASPAYTSLELIAQMGDARVTVVRTEATLRGRPADLVTLLAGHGPARGVTTTGLRYPLVAEDLEPGSTRGVSNRLTGEVATVAVASGTLLAVQPNHHARQPSRS